MSLIADIEQFLAETRTDASDPPGLVLERRLERFSDYLVHVDGRGTGDLYIGRPHLWGNRFLGSVPSDPDEARRVVLAYAVEFAGRSEQQRDYMLRRVTRVIRRGDRLLRCCSVKLCHGQVLAAWALGFGPKLLEGLDLEAVR